MWQQCHKRRCAQKRNWDTENPKQRWSAAWCYCKVLPCWYFWLSMLWTDHRFSSLSSYRATAAVPTRLKLWFLFLFWSSSSQSLKGSCHTLQCNLGHMASLPPKLLFTLLLFCLLIDHGKLARLCWSRFLLFIMLIVVLNQMCRHWGSSECSSPLSPAGCSDCHLE